MTLCLSSCLCLFALCLYLPLQYNRDRQATITNELIEIISGAAALEEAS
jgi:hypothetical protein